MEYDFGPEWFWKGLGCLALIGIIGVVFSIVRGIIWLFNHVTIDW